MKESINITTTWIYTDGSKTDKHVGAGMVAMKECREIHTESMRLNNDRSAGYAWQ
jgi:hypothetical protein